jgi:hypothetical protein
MDMEEKQRLLVKGGQTPIRALLAEGRRHVLLGKEHPEELKEAGWPQEETDTLEKQTVELDSRYSVRSASISQAQDATVNKTRCRQRAKALIRKIRLAVPIVLRKHQIPGVTKSSFNNNGKIGTSATNISQYLAKIRPHVQTMDEHLKPRFNGKSALNLLETVKADLDNSSATQSTLYNDLPVETAAIYLLAGQLLELIEEMNVAGKIAFDGDAASAAKFNKDLILKAVKKPSEEESEVEPKAQEKAAK